MPTLEGVQAHQSKIYYEFSHLYDKIFTRVFYPRIEGAIVKLDIAPGAKVLEVGAGTGLAFPAYPSHCHVTGIDLAPEMLEQAQEKIVRNGWRHINVTTMDALNLDFPDDTFDYVTAFHVVSVVPDTRRLIKEVQRVCRPSGTVVVVNHFRSHNRLLAALDRSIEPVTRRLGWRTLALDEVFADPSLTVRSRYKTSSRSLFTVVVAENRK
jgi:phosphatidylethanolamine/phosphatidyl-N-methylethanolamine N-methyltransferase